MRRFSLISKLLLAVGVALFATALAISGVGSTALAADAAKADPAAKLFKSKCGACHGTAGKPTKAGAKAGAKDWTDGKTLAALTDDQIRQLIRDGKKGDDGKQKMPKFAKLTADEVTALVGVVRKLQK